ncbi:ATP synthase F0 subunit B [Geothermobacter hydrogeniphilus]|uniref:ATP synthase subunit b n=1 Tax=Geothermobacter hydrogeniphilus TaxID=1969733 RepID=A0A2K2HAW1_9BACT|nr:F0F1 ATP synthase subunit B [Geothermobacter hydrogeniphilus]PNU20401.1 ATP synthase F0 subunit B [Geothermobacter hydrogeniphilus]
MSTTKTNLFKTLIIFSIVLAAGTVFASGGEHQADGGVLLKDFLWRCLNFAVTFGLLAYFITKPLRNGLAGRRQGIADSLAAAEKMKAEAEAKFAEYDRKLSRAAEEIEEIYQQIRREGEREKERILDEARQMAIKVRSEAEKSAALEVARARRELREEASRLAVDIAEEMLRKKFTKKDQTRLVDEYIQKVGELH